MQNLFPKLSLPSAFTFSITGFFNCLHVCTLNWGKQKTKYKFDSAPSFMCSAAKLMPKLAALVCSQQYRTRQSIPFTAVHRIKHWHSRGEKSWVPAAARRQSQSRLCLAVVSSQEGLGLPVGAVLPSGAWLCRDGSLLGTERYTQEFHQLPPWNTSFWKYPRACETS